MGTFVFIPVSDELLFEHPELIRTPLVPYRPGMRLTPNPGLPAMRGRSRSDDRSGAAALEAHRDE